MSLSLPLSETILQAGLETLLAEMGRLTQEAEMGSDVKPAEFERLAKAISSHLKAVDDIHAHRTRIETQDKLRNFTAYEDLPPPSPEERARIIKRLQKLYASIDLGAAIERATLRHGGERLDRDEP